MSDGPASQRGALGALCASFGLLHLLPVAFVLLSSVGPAPVLVSGRFWSGMFFGHFLGLVIVGFAYLFYVSGRGSVFHGGPLIDFLIAIAGFIMVSTLAGALLNGKGPSWPALTPGVYLICMGLRLRTRRALL